MQWFIHKFTIGKINVHKKNYSTLFTKNTGIFIQTLNTSEKIMSVHLSAVLIKLILNLKIKLWILKMTYNQPNCKITF